MKRSIKYVFSLVILVGGGVLMSAYQKQQPMLPDSSSTLANEYYAKRVKDYSDDYLQKCRAKMIEDAEAYVDSMIIDQINVEVMDGILFPEKPLKPEYPDNIILDDTTLTLSKKKLLGK